jgi:hypothetical protein
LVLTTALALLSGLLASIRMPDFVRATLAVVLAVEVFYMVFRMPILWRELRELRHRRQQLLRHRRQLADEVARLKRRHAKSAQPPCRPAAD